MCEYTKDWKYRFSNFQWALAQLERSLDTVNFSDKIPEELKVFLDVASELALKTLHDYLTESGLVYQTPQEMLDISIQQGLITDIDIWKRLIKNEPVTTPDGGKNCEENIRVNYRALKSLHSNLNRLIVKNSSQHH